MDHMAAGVRASTGGTTRTTTRMGHWKNSYRREGVQSKVCFLNLQLHNQGLYQAHTESLNDLNMVSYYAAVVHGSHHCWERLCFLLQMQPTPGHIATGRGCGT